MILVLFSNQDILNIGWEKNIKDYFEEPHYSELTTEETVNIEWD